jgi:cell division protein FtsL
MAAPVIATPRPKPRPRKPATAPTRAERNEKALAKARAVQRSGATAVARPAPARVPAPARKPAPARRKSGAAKPRTTAPATSPVARVLNSRGMPLVDRILRGPAWVVMLGALLAGIVFLNVSVLELNRGIARTDAKSAELERTNSGLRARVAKLDNGERIQQLAAARGFVMPQPGDVTYVYNRASNARLAAQRITPPSAAPALQSSGTAATTATGTTTSATSATSSIPASTTVNTPTTTVP